MNLELALQMIAEAITNATFLPFAVAAGVLLTALLKQVPLLNKANAGIVALVAQVVIWGIFTIAHERFGVSEETFASVLNALVTLGGAAFGITASAIAQERVYQNAKANAVPVIGAKKRGKVAKPDTLPEPMTKAAG